MASTLKPTVFSIKIKETHVVNDIRTVNENFYRIPDVTNYDRRVVTVPNTTSIDLINVNGIDPGAGTFPSSSLKYGRITNLDDTYSLAVNFTSSAGVSGILYPLKELYPASYTNGGTGGTPGNYNDKGVTGGTGTNATFDIITNNSAGMLNVGQNLFPQLFQPSVTVTQTPDPVTITNISLTGDSGGSGAVASINFRTGKPDTIIITKAGTGYSIGENIILTSSELNALTGISGASGDMKFTLVSDNIIVAPTSIIVNNQGSGYAINDILTIAGSNLVGASDLKITLGASDFTTNGAKSYWTMDVLPTASLMFSSPNVTGSQFVGTFGQDIEFISVYAISSSIDVEYVIVNA